MIAIAYVALCAGLGGMGGLLVGEMFTRYLKIEKSDA